MGLSKTCMHLHLLVRDCVHCTHLQVSQDQEAKANEKEAREQARKTKEAAQLYAALQVQQSQLDELWHKYQATCSAICLPLHPLLPLYHMLMTVFRKRYPQTAMHARAYARNANVRIQPNELGKNKSLGIWRSSGSRLNKKGRCASCGKRKKNLADRSCRCVRGVGVPLRAGPAVG
jgi:hypothetical protein